MRKLKPITLLCGTDAVVTHDKLIDGHQRLREKLNRLEPSLSGMVFLWGVSGKHPTLAHHNIVFSSDYDTEFRQIFKYQRVPDAPTIYIAITGKTDAGHAPADGEKLVCVVKYAVPSPLGKCGKKRRFGCEPLF